MLEIQDMQLDKKKMKKVWKKMKKGVDKGVWYVYNTSSRREQDTSSETWASDMILENDTESRRTRSRDFHESRRNKDSQFV